MYHNQDVLGFMEFSFIDDTEKLQAITIGLFMLTSDRVANPSPIRALATSLPDRSELSRVEKPLKPGCHMVTQVNRIGKQQHFVALLNCNIILSCWSYSMP